MLLYVSVASFENMLVFQSSSSILTGFQTLSRAPFSQPLLTLSPAPIRGRVIPHSGEGEMAKRGQKILDTNHLADPLHLMKKPGTSA